MNDDKIIEEVIATAITQEPEVLPQIENPVTFVAINMHGGTYSTNSDLFDQTPVMLSRPSNIRVRKITLAFPGTTGYDKSLEAKRAARLLYKDPNIGPDDMIPELIKIYEHSVPIRRKFDKKMLKSDPKTPHRDTSMTTIKGWDYKEPRAGKFFFKKYMIDKNLDNNIHSITILNGRFAGQNILDAGFLAGINYMSLFRPDNIHFFSDTHVLIQSINLKELIDLLYFLGIRDVCIIDPSCSDNFIGQTARSNRTMKMIGSRIIADPSLSHISVPYPLPEGAHSIVVDSPPRLSSRSRRLLLDQELRLLDNECVDCSQYNKEACAVGAVSGLTCCVGSCAYGAPNIASVALGTISGVAAHKLYEKVKSQSMNRGGLKKHFTKSNRPKRKKTKRNKLYKKKYNTSYK